MYYIEFENKIVLADDNLERLRITLQCRPEYEGSEIKETERPLVQGDGEYIYADTPEYEEEQKQKERERIGNLQVTKRVFMLGLQQLDLTYSQLKELISTNEQAQMEWELCVELQRKNPLLDIMASQLGVSSLMLDYIFQKANGEDVEPPVIEDSSEEE